MSIRLQAENSGSGRRSQASNHLESRFAAAELPILSKKPHCNAAVGLLSQAESPPFREGSVCRKTQSWPPMPANSATLVCGESAAAQRLGAPPYNPGRRQCLLHLHFFDALSPPFREGFFKQFFRAAAPGSWGFRKPPHSGGRKSNRGSAR